VKNYREAKKGEVMCTECEHSGISWLSQRLQCLATYSLSAVGRDATCDRAKKKEGYDCC